MSKWISVKDALPVDAAVIIYAPSEDPENPLIALVWHDRPWGWSRIPDCWTQGITHWMPMPLPPGKHGKREIEIYSPEEKT